MYKVNKVIVDWDTPQAKKYKFRRQIFTHTKDLEYPYFAGSFNELVVFEPGAKMKEKFEEDVEIFNNKGLAKLVVPVGNKGLYYLQLRPGFKIEKMYVEPDEVVTDIYVGEDSLIYSFYNTTQRQTITITASIKKDNDGVYSRLKSDLTDIHWRQYFIRLAQHKFEESELNKPFPANMTAEQVAEYLQLDIKTIRNWTSENKIPSVKLGGSVRYPKDLIDNWLKSKENKVVRG